ncbi:MAG: hypothetical protein N2A40_07520, partial [Desulfobulbaceae bacterium]
LSSTDDQENVIINMRPKAHSLVSFFLKLWNKNLPSISLYASSHDNQVSLHSFLKKKDILPPDYYNSSHIAILKT